MRMSIINTATTEQMGQGIFSYIEGEPYISTVPLDPGMTNIKERKEGSIKETETPEQIRGLNTENSELNEGMIRFDIIFYVRMKDGLTQIIVNIEAQKEEPGKYYILNRAIFYIGRIVSSQKGRDFVKSEYNKMKRVYSIWICMNMKENSLTQIYPFTARRLRPLRWEMNCVCYLLDRAS